MIDWHSLRQNILREWRANLRLRWGVGAIALILAGYALLLLQEQRAVYRKDFSRLQARLSRMQLLAAHPEWRELAQEFRARRIAWEERLWRADSPGMAHATVEAWLVAQTRKAKLDKLRVQVAQAVRLEGEGLDDLWQVGASLQGSADMAGILRLLHILESDARLHRIDRLDIDGPPDRPRLSINLRVYFQPLE